MNEAVYGLSCHVQPDTFCGRETIKFKDKKLQELLTESYEEYNSYGGLEAIANTALHFGGNPIIIITTFEYNTYRQEKRNLKIREVKWSKYRKEK